jgi:hypothetical protein
VIIINDTFAILWGSVLLVDETVVFSEINQLAARNLQMLSHFDQLQALIFVGTCCNVLYISVFKCSLDIRFTFT